MLLGDEYKLEADRLNLILYKKVTQEQLIEEAIIAFANEEELEDMEQYKIEDDSESTIKWKRLGFFNTITNVLMFISNNEIKEGINLQPLEQLIVTQRELALLFAALDFSKVTLKTLMDKDKLPLPDKPQPASTYVSENLGQTADIQA